MSTSVTQLFDFNWKEMLIHTGQMLIAFVLILPIGLNRENSKFSMGLRTFPMVSLASCGFTLVGFGMSGNDDSQISNVINGVVTGIGFIGGGAILKTDNSIEGTSTAAAIWAAGCVGVAVAMGRLEIAVLVSLMTFLIFYFATPLKETLSNDSERP
ncbi:MULTISPECIES: MgtC/SapB family protein [unclassified Moraxella]|uniref:MgtC/SapB family protein n=1 Tax=unclassified Moraxella TaxID=2685852 RepID=UPI003AF4EB74